MPLFTGFGRQTFQVGSGLQVNTAFTNWMSSDTTDFQAFYTAFQSQCNNNDPQAFVDYLKRQITADGDPLKPFPLLWLQLLETSPSMNLCFDLQRAVGLSESRISKHSCPHGL